MWHNGDEGVPTLDHNSPYTPFVWQGAPIAQAVMAATYTRNFAQAEPPTETIHYRPARIGKKNHEPYLVDPTKMHLKSAKVGKDTAYANAITLAEGVDSDAVGLVLRAFLHFDAPTYSPDFRQAKAYDLLTRMTEADPFEAEQADLVAAQVAAVSAQFYAYLAQTFAPTGSERLVAVSDNWAGKRRFEATIDLVLTTKKGFVLLQHDPTAHSSKDKLRARVDAHATTLLLAKTALAKAKNCAAQAIRTFVHFGLAGVVIEVE